VAVGYSTVHSAFEEVEHARHTPHSRFERETVHSDGGVKYCTVCPCGCMLSDPITRDIGNAQQSKQQSVCAVPGSDISPPFSTDSTHLFLKT
jgi:hypothetical protein